MSQKNIYNHSDGTVEVIVEGVPTTLKKHTLPWMKKVGMALMSDEDIKNLYIDKIEMSRLDNMAKEQSHV